MSNYQDFVKRKRIRTEDSGFDVRDDDINPMLFDWQKKIVS